MRSKVFAKYFAETSNLSHGDSELPPLANFYTVEEESLFSVPPQCYKSEED